MVVNWPAMVMEIIPAQVQVSFELSFKAGMFPINTVGDPGAQGAGVLGMQGIGVSTPMAADVADATVGFAKLVHMPKGLMFTMGLWSMMFAAGWLPHIVQFCGSTPKVEGAMPKVHIIMALLTT